MKIEMHAHTLPVSPCARHYPADCVRALEKMGYDAVVVTNHYSRHVWLNVLKGTQAEKMSAYLNAYHECCAAAQTLKVLLGAEVALQTDSGWAEFLLYGVDEEFLRTAPPLIELTQQELHELCHANGIVVVQAHPFRSEQGHTPWDTRYMDGVEVNCHPYFLRREEQVRALAEENGLLITAGSDFHGDGLPIAGIITETDVSDARELADILRARQYKYFFGNVIRDL